MNIEESQNFKERIDRVLEAAQQYESSAKELAKVKAKVDEYIELAKNNNEGLLTVTEKTEEMLDNANNLYDKISREVYSRLNEELQELVDCIGSCKKNQENITEAYRSALAELEASKKIKVGEALSVQEKIDSTVKEIKQSSDSLKTSSESLANAISILPEQIKEKNSVILVDTVVPAINGLSERLSSANTILSKVENSTSSGLRSIEQKTDMLARDIRTVTDSSGRTLNEISNLANNNAQQHSAMIQSISSLEKQISMLNNSLSEMKVQLEIVKNKEFSLFNFK